MSKGGNNGTFTEKVPEQSRKCVVYGHKYNDSADDYMYGDYTTLNAFLISNYSIRIPKLPPALEEVPDEVHYDDMHEVIEYLQHSIQSSFDQMKGGSDDTEPPELKVFDWEQLLQLIEKEISRISLLLDNPQQKI